MTIDEIAAIIKETEEEYAGASDMKRRHMIAVNIDAALNKKKPKTEKPKTLGIHRGGRVPVMHIDNGEGKPICGAKSSVVKNGARIRQEETGWVCVKCWQKFVEEKGER